jgi:uncharacterized protein with HEPN domain
MNRDYQRLLDIQEAIERIEKYAAQGRDAFNDEELIQTWVVYHLQIIGEAIGKLSDELKILYPEVPWKKIRGMRNILVHDYFGIDLDIVWRVIEVELPDLKDHICSMLEKEKPLD